MRDVVLKYQMHQCDRDSVCWAGGDRCKRGYPQPLSPVTFEDARGQIRYMRLTEEDRRVVPYSPALLSLLRSHQCIEVCLSGPGCVAYLLNYTLKGSDKALVESVERRHADEQRRNPQQQRNYIQEFIDMRDARRVRGGVSPARSPRCAALIHRHHAAGAHERRRRRAGALGSPLARIDGAPQRRSTRCCSVTLRATTRLQHLLVLEWAEQYILRDARRQRDVPGVTMFKDKLEPAKYACRRDASRGASVHAATLTRLLADARREAVHAPAACSNAPRAAMTTCVLSAARCTRRTARRRARSGLPV
jgi:hypothetical protein